MISRIVANTPCGSGPAPGTVVAWFQPDPGAQRRAAPQPDPPAGNDGAFPVGTVSSFGVALPVLLAWAIAAGVALQLVIRRR